MKRTTSLNRMLLCLLLLCLLVLPGAAARAADPELPLEGYREISAFELKQLIDSGRKAAVVNVLSPLEYDAQHIPGSINIPIIDMLQTRELPAHKNTPLVFYCLSER